jgi:hypothetical protein
MPYLTATPLPQKVSSFSKPVWLVVQTLTGTIRVAGRDQDIKDGGGLIYRAASEPAYEAVADTNYEGFWYGDLWIAQSGAAPATFQWEAHQTTPAPAIATTLPTKR